MVSSHFLDQLLHRQFVDRDQQLTDELPVETSHPSVLHTISDSSAVRESPLVVHRNSTISTNSIMIISPFVSHLIFTVVV
ncbi:hypothetical protein HAX54_030994, partial [Datura stramonium]|nr:hypothetical protein [Datura stramonium]